MTTIGTTAAAIGGARLEQQLEPEFHAIGLGAGTSLAAVIVMVTFLELVVGELVPKSLALRYSDRYSFFVARPLVALSQVMRPLVWTLTGVSNVFLRMFGDRTTFTEARLSRDELQQLGRGGGQDRLGRPRASEIASRALGFGEVTVAEVMVPAPGGCAAARRAPEEVQRVILEQGTAGCRSTTAASTTSSATSSPATSSPWPGSTA